MSLRKKIPNRIQQEIRARAENLCEYCHTSEEWQYVKFTIDHIIPISLGGTNDKENLCLACFHCNRRKSNKVRAIDPQSGEEVPLFHPRKQSWNDHFIWSSDKLRIIGLTSVGRATIEALELNRERIVYIRAADVVVDRHPPTSDNIE